MLLCICSIIDHRWRQNTARTKRGTWEEGIYFWTNAREHGIYAFYTIKGQIIWNFVCFNQIKNESSESFPILANSWKQPFDAIYGLCNLKQIIGFLTNKCIAIDSEKPHSCQTRIESCHHLCVCPLIDHSWEPIKTPADLSLLYIFNK